MMESLTNELAEQARELIAEVEKEGGTGKAIEIGLPKLRIGSPRPINKRELIAVKMSSSESNNLPEGAADEFEVLSIDNEKVRDAQIERLQSIKASRDSTQAEACLKAITDCAQVVRVIFSGLLSKQYVQGVQWEN